MGQETGKYAGALINYQKLMKKDLILTSPSPKQTVGNKWIDYCKIAEKI